MKGLKGLVLFLALSCLALAGRAEVYQRILAKVGSAIITTFDVEEQLAVFQGQMTQEEIDSAEGKKKLEDTRRQILEQMIKEKLVIQAAQKSAEDAKEAEGKATAKPNPFLPKEEEVDEEVTKALDEARSRYPSHKEFADELAREHMTEAGLETRMRERVRDRLILQKMMKAKQKEFQGTFSVTSDEAQEYYGAHKEQFGSGDQVRLRHILIAGGKNPREAAEKIKKRILAGESFEDLAGRYSEDPLSKGNGGMLGWIEKGQTDYPQLEKAAFAASEGQVVGPVKTARGWHVIRVEETKAGAVKPFDQVRNQVMNYLYSTKMADRTEAWIKELREKSYVEIMPSL